MTGIIGLALKLSMVMSGFVGTAKLMEIFYNSGGGKGGRNNGNSNNLGRPRV